MEKQVPPPSWHDEVDLPRDFDDDFYCPLTSVVCHEYLLVCFTMLIDKHQLK